MTNVLFPQPVKSVLLSRAQQFTERLARVRLSHEMLADEERVKSRSPKARQIFVGAQAGFADGDAFIGDGRNQFGRSFDAHFERAQVAVVQPQAARTRRQSPSQL